MSNEPVIRESQSLLDVREWKRKVSEEVERLGYSGFRERCLTDADLKALRERVLRHQKPLLKAVKFPEPNVMTMNSRKSHLS